MEADLARETSPKRRPGTLEDISAPKRQRRAYHRHHAFTQQPQSNVSKEPALVEASTVDKLLTEAIKNVLEEEALKQDIYEPQVESLALEALRNAVDESCAVSDETSRKSSTAAYTSPDDPFHESAKLPSSLLGAELTAQNELKRFSLTTTSLPPLPSAHTYKDTAVFPKRETDTRRIRELATEEGKLGEQALRRLAGAVKLDASHPLEHESKQPKEDTLRSRSRRRKRKPDVTEETVFEETVRELLKAEPEGFELGPMVTSEKTYRMPDDTQVKRRPMSDSKGKAPALGVSTDSPKYRWSSGGPEVMQL